MPTVEVTTREQLEAILKQNNNTAVIDFHATWCGPCKVIGPKAATLSDQYKVLLIKIDVDQAE